MPIRDGNHAVIDQFLADGITHLFGNPGTVEEGLLDVLGEYPQFRYIFALHESVAIAMADGYARASRRPAAVQLHSGVGLGNGIGMLYQAWRGHSPLVVIAGEAGIRYDAMDGQMAADLVAMARPVTKYATRVVHPTSLLRVLRRATKVAVTPPEGPVFVALPMDVLDAPNDEPVYRTSVIDTRTAPVGPALREAALRLAAARNPLILTGDGIARSDAASELERVAELIGAAVWGGNASEVNMRAGHPCYRGSLGHMFGFESTPILTEADVVLICGTTVLPEVFPDVSGGFSPDAEIIQIDQDLFEIAKNHRVTRAFAGEPKASLALLADRLESVMTAEQRQDAARRIDRLVARKNADRARIRSDERCRGDGASLTVSRFMEELSGRLPADAVIFDEAITHSPDLVRHFPPVHPGRYFQTRGGTLGVGIPGAIGIKLAKPESAVIGVTGDGGFLYTPQALWTAAHHGVDAKFVVCNNRSYRILKFNILQYWKERSKNRGAFPPMFDIKEPDIRYDMVAESLGVPAVRVETPAAIAPALDRALSHPGPFLIDLVVEDRDPEDRNAGAPAVEADVSAG